MFPDLGKTQQLPQIDINVVEARATGNTLIFTAPLFIVDMVSPRRGSGQIHFSVVQFGKSS